MFRPLERGAPERAISLTVDGHPVLARDGDTLAIALLNAAIVPFRHTALSGAPRAPLCLMGACFECLVEVDGRANVQACMVPAREGMQVRLPRGARPMPAPHPDGAPQR